MLTIVTVYNKKDFLERVLLDSLQKQSVPFELIAIDNTNGKYTSAAHAFNTEVKSPKGDYIMFVHQDVDFGNDVDWLKNVEQEARKLKDAGIMGIVGVDARGKRQGYLSDSGRKLGKPEPEAVEVQTLDELLFIIPKQVFEEHPFDEKTFDGWHLYCADYCLMVQQHALKAYVIPAFVYHRSLATNRTGLAKYKRRLFSKYHFPIFTTLDQINRKTLVKDFLVQLVSKRLYTFLFPRWISLLRREVHATDTLLDLGCGYNSPVQQVPAKKKVGVEAFPDYLEESRKKAIHDEYVEGNILDVDFPPHSFDVVFASEVIEHMEKEDGERLLDNMERWASKKAILTTPNGFVSQESFDDNDMQEHKSGWTVSDFRKRGYRVYGMNGFKCLHGSQRGFIRGPWYLLVLLTDLSQKIAYFFPSLAFQLFAVKDISDRPDTTHA